MIQKRIYNYFERNPQLRVLFLFDKMESLEADLSEKIWPGDYVYKVFDGKWFNIKVALQREWKEKKVILVFPHELRPDTEEKRLKFPLLDVYASNLEFKDERYEEFMQQYGLSPKVAAFVKSNIEELSSNRIFPMFRGYLDSESFTVDLGCRAIISSYLGEKRPLDWDDIIVKLLIFSTKNEEKRSAEFFLKLYKNRDARKALDDRLKSIFGVTFNPDIIDKMRPIAEILKYNAITQSFPANRNDDYRHLKITGRGALDQINRIYEKGMQESQYGAKFRDAMNELASDVKETELIKVYGVDAPYYYMPENLILPILSDIIGNEVVSNPEEAIEKVRSLSLRLNAETKILPLVKYVETVASFHDAVNNLGGLRLDSQTDYVSLYTVKFSTIDRYYRLSIELFHQLPELDDTTAAIVVHCKNDIDGRYAQITNQLNYEWLDCVVDSGNTFDKTGLLKQDNFYSTYQDPKKLVVIISDALRYDVGMELYEELAKKKHIASLTPMLSLLPSETKFCKPALFPHSELNLVGDNMETDGKILSSIKQRTEQLCKYRSNSVCVNFKDVSSQVSSHRELFKHPLVYVLHDCIDKTGHDQSPRDIVESCRKAIEELARFVNSLHVSLACSNVIITSDHGFLFNDMKFEDKDKIQIQEDSIDSSTRYYLTLSDSPVDEVVKFELEQVSGIMSAEKTYIATPKGTNRFAAQGGYTFTHGGASLQEMVLPVIYSKRRIENSKRPVDVIVKSNNLNMVSSRLNFQLVQKEAVSMDVLAREVVCRLYDGDRLVSDEVKVMLDSTDAYNISKRTFDVTLKLSESGVSSLLQLRIYDSDPNKQLNPLVKETVRNVTIIEQDF